MGDVIEHFRVGQPVEVAPDFRHVEWQRIPLWIVAVRAIERSSYDVSYDVSERWPVQSLSDITTDFSSEDLVVRPTQEGA